MLSFKATDLSRPGLKAFLVDKFLGTQSPIAIDGTTTRYYFTGTSDAASLNATRFDIVFTEVKVDEIELVVIDSRPNNLVKWTVQKQELLMNYQVEYRRGIQQYRSLYAVDAKAGTPAPYDWTHKNVGAGMHYYRINGITVEGKTIYSNEVSFETVDDLSEFKVFPDSVTSQTSVTIELKDFIPGNYRVSIVDAFGKVIQTVVVKHGGGTAAYPLNIPSGLAGGLYTIQITGRGSGFTQSLIKQ